MDALGPVRVCLSGCVPPSVTTPAPFWSRPDPSDPRPRFLQGLRPIHRAGRHGARGPDTWPHPSTIPIGHPSVTLRVPWRMTGAVLAETPHLSGSESGASTLALLVGGRPMKPGCPGMVRGWYVRHSRSESLLLPSPKPLLFYLWVFLPTVSRSSLSSLPPLPWCLPHPRTPRGPSGVGGGPGPSLQRLALRPPPALASAFSGSAGRE